MRWPLGRPEGGRYILLLILLTAQPAEAAVSDYIGKTVAEVRLQIRGAAIQSEELVEIVETRAGAPLTMIEVRESMAHLFGLGLYQDVQVDAVAQGDGVVLTYNLFPAQRVRRIVFEGTLALPENDLRRMIVERHGASPSFARSAQAVASLEALYRERGYPKAEIAVRTGNDADPSNMSMVFIIRPGPRARIGAIEVQGTPRDPAPQVLNALNLRVGDQYDGIEIDRASRPLRGRAQGAGLLRSESGALSALRRW